MIGHTKFMITISCGRRSSLTMMIPAYSRGAARYKIIANLCIDGREGGYPQRAVAALDGINDVPAWSRRKSALQWPPGTDVAMESAGVTLVRRWG